MSSDHDRFAYERTYYGDELARHQALIKFLKAQQEELVSEILLSHQSNLLVSTAVIEETLNTSNLELIKFVFDNINPQSILPGEIFEYVGKIQSAPALRGALSSQNFRRIQNDKPVSNSYHWMIRYVTDLATLRQMINLLLVNDLLPRTLDLYYLYVKNWDEILDRILMDARINIQELDAYLQEELDQYPPGLIIQRSHQLKETTKVITSEDLQTVDRLIRANKVDLVTVEAFRLNEFREVYSRSNQALAEELNRLMIPRREDINHYQAALIVAYVHNPSKLEKIIYSTFPAMTIPAIREL
ncbi:Hypothetical protein POVR1_LOCUS69 [uncultured virus]|nr:Hypothetical protein POVR1_LOCUS69 [uncultured virus]